MTAQARRLGRGLSSLIPSAATATGANGGDGSPLFVAIDMVVPREDQPRRYFDDHGLRQLAVSIREQGILQPLVVTPADDGRYTLIAGERRLRASALAGLKEVPVIVRTTTPGEVFELALIENIQRQDLNPVEEAEAYQRLIEEHNYTQEALARRVGKDRTTITNALRLLKLRPTLRVRLAEGRITAGHARALLGVEDESLQDKLCLRIEAEGLSVRAVERLIADSDGARKPRPTRPSDPKRAERARLGARLQTVLNRPVKIRASGQGGTVTLSYKTEEDLQALIESLAKPSGV